MLEPIPFEVSDFTPCENAHFVSRPVIDAAVCCVKRSSRLMHLITHSSHFAIWIPPFDEWTPRHLLVWGMWVILSHSPD